MVCIYCGHETEVYNSRVKARTPSVWRRRRCQACVAQFTTVELPDYAGAIVVRSLAGDLSPFSRDKLFLSLYRSLSHREDALQSATELTGTLIGKLLRGKTHKDGTLVSSSIATHSYQILRRYDLLAANSYKAYHLRALKPS